MKQRMLPMQVATILGAALLATAVHAGTDGAPARDMRMSALIGQEIETRDGRNLGEVEDLIVDMRDGRVAYAVVDPDDEASLGDDQLVAVPVEEARGATDGQRIVADMDPARLAAFHRFEKDRWPDWSALERSSPGAEGTAAGRQERFRRASRLLDAQLKDQAGKDIGGVEDIVVNVRDGRIRYGVAQFDPSWYQQGKLVVVPLAKVRAYPEDPDKLVITMDRSELRQAPAFDRDRWPDVNEQGFRERLSRFLALG